MSSKEKKTVESVKTEAKITVAKFFAPAIEGKVLAEGEEIEAVANIAKIAKKQGKFGEFSVYSGVFQWRKKGSFNVLTARKMFVPSKWEEMFTEKEIGKRLVFTFTGKDGKVGDLNPIEGFEGGDIDPFFLK